MLRLEEQPHILPSTSIDGFYFVYFQAVELQGSVREKEHLPRFLLAVCSDADRFVGIEEAFHQRAIDEHLHREFAIHEGSFPSMVMALAAEPLLLV